MFSHICRVTDQVTGVCEADAPGHPRAFVGTWNTGSIDCTANGLGLIRQGDTGTTDCGHPFIANGGSIDVVSNGLLIQRVGDPVTLPLGGYGNSITGSPDVTSN